MKKLIILGLLFSHSLMAQTLNGKIMNATGEMRRFSGEKCEISTEINENLTVDAMISVAISNQGVSGMTFIEKNLTPKFSGNDLYSPKYELESLRGINNTLIVYLNPENRDKIISVEAFKLGTKFNYTFECVVD